MNAMSASAIRTSSPAALTPRTSQRRENSTWRLNAPDAHLTDAVADDIFLAASLHPHGTLLVIEGSHFRRRSTGLVRRNKEAIADV